MWLCNSPAGSPIVDPSLYWEIVFSNLPTLNTIIIKLNSKRNTGYQLLPGTLTHFSPEETPEKKFEVFFKKNKGYPNPLSLIPADFTSWKGHRLSAPHLEFEYVPHLSFPSISNLLLDASTLVSLCISESSGCDEVLLKAGKSYVFRKLKYLSLVRGPTMQTVHTIMFCLPALIRFKVVAWPGESFDSTCLATHVNSLEVLWIESWYPGMGSNYEESRTEDEENTPTSRKARRLYNHRQQKLQRGVISSPPGDFEEFSKLRELAIVTTEQTLKVCASNIFI